MNILLWLCYNGTAYHGFQVQQNAHTVCAEIQNAMQAVLGSRPDVKGCSRTDAGVHARQYALSFKHDTAIPLHKLPLALNSALPGDIRVTAAQRVPMDFHARYSATGKEYEYVILNNAVDDPFAPGLYFKAPQPLNAQAMDTTAKQLCGRQDFASFQSAGSSVQDTVRTVHAAAVRREGARVVFTVSADGFLYNMVRIMAGTVLQAGRGKLAPEEMRAVIAAKDRTAAGDTLPAKGLFLNRVFYRPEDLEG